MVTVLMEFQTQTGKGNEFRDYLLDSVEHTRSQGGCKGVRVYQDQEDADRVVEVAFLDFGG